MNENMSEIPDGWHIQRKTVRIGTATEGVYVARHWQKDRPARKHWWSLPQKKIITWFPVYQSTSRDAVVQFIRGTQAALEATRDGA